ncbi:MAG: sensor domain-containing diguanylate cyclase [Hydrogenovibrio sp.]
MNNILRWVDGGFWVFCTVFIGMLLFSASAWSISNAPLPTASVENSGENSGENSADSARPVVPWQAGQSQLRSFPVGLWVDSNGHTPFLQVEKQVFVPAQSRFTLGTDAKVIWMKWSLENTAGQPKTLYLHHNKAYHIRELAVYVTTPEGKIEQHEPLRLDKAAASRRMFKGVAVFPIHLPAHQTRVVWVRTESYSHQWGELALYDSEYSMRALATMQIDVAIVVGLFLALIFYNAIIFFSSRAKEHIYYALYLLAGLTWISLSYGFLAMVFDLYGSLVFRLNLTLILMPIFLLLFMVQVFETRQKYPLEHRFLLGMLLLLVADFVYGLYDVAGALKPASSLAALTMLVTLSVSVSLVIKKHPLAKYFLIGHSLFVAMNVMAVLFYKGYIEYSYLSSHAVGIGIVLEALTLAFIIAYRMRMLEQMKLEQVELQRLATTDPMTGLHNRRYFFEEGQQRLAKMSRKGSAMSVVMVDIDHFKRINDTFGHGQGDAVIEQVARQLKTGCSPDSLLARFGGEEFVLLLPNTDLHQAWQQAEALRTTLAAGEKRWPEASEIRITASFGVAEVVPERGLEEALQRADQALYDAKRSGRNRVCKNFDGGRFPPQAPA